MKLLLLILFVPLLSFSAPSEKNPPPRLVVTIVIDQFRADLLMRFSDKFKKTGFRRLMDQGAVFPFAQYPTLQNMTCPGHTMILTGTVPARNGIPLNDWWNPETKRLTYCAEDPEFGLSPRNMNGDTLGDEMKLRWPSAKVVGVALKDRAAIMLAGKAADAAYWYDEEQLQWVTSSYYKNASPKMKNWNAPGTPKKGDAILWKNSLGSRPFEHKYNWGTEEALSHPMSLDQARAATEAAFEAHGLGQDEIPDLLAFSISTHDLAGHRYGPDSAEIEDMTLQEDRVLSDFFAFLDKKVPGGLENVWIFFTADHGVAPTVERAKELGLDAGRMNQKENLKQLNALLKEKFGSCHGGDWIPGVKSFNFYWDLDCLTTARMQKKEVERFAKDQMLMWKGVENVFTRAEYEAGRLPAAFETQIKKSYVPGTSGDIVIIPKPFWYEQGPPATHVTSYTYDRTVPLIFFGKPFKAGVYSTQAWVTDAAPTLAHALRVIAPAMTEGRVLSEALKPEKL